MFPQKSTDVIFTMQNYKEFYITKFMLHKYWMFPSLYCQVPFSCCIRGENIFAVFIPALVIA